MRQQPVVNAYPAIHFDRRSMVLSVLAGSALVFAGCATPPLKTDDKVDRHPFWPRPPDRPRYLYEHALRTPADILADVKELQIRQMITGDRSANLPAFEKPVSVAAHQGRIYVTDSVKRRVVTFDVPRRKVFVFGWRAPGQLQKPIGIALDSRSNVYVADIGLQQIMMYDAWGLLVRRFGDAKTLERPTGVAVNAAGTRVYAIDRASNESELHRVAMFDGEGRFLRHIGKRGSRNGEFNVPVAGACAPDGTLYVLDAGNFRVQALTADGEFKFGFGGVGIGFGDLARPRGLAVDGQGNVYVSDASFNNVQIFDPKGQLLLAVGQLSRSDFPGRYGLVSGVAVDETGRIYIADQLFNKIEVLRPLKDFEADILLKGGKLTG